MPLEFATISVSDGISMGHEGMHASLVSREVIADSVETVMFAERFDGTVLLAGCDKSLPGMLMAAARLDLASVFLYAGTSLPGRAGGRDLTIVDMFEGVGACAAGRLSRDDLDEMERGTCPGEGACAGMYTANTMASAAEALGMSLPGSASPPAVDRRRDDFARPRARPSSACSTRASPPGRSSPRRRSRTPSPSSWRSAARPTPSCTSSRSPTRRVSTSPSTTSPASATRTPHLADVKPFGRYVMVDVDRVGGVPVVMKALLDAGLLHGDALTVTGRSVAENLAHSPRQSRTARSSTRSATRSTAPAA